MRKFSLAAILIILAILLSSCGNPQPVTIGNDTYNFKTDSQYNMINKDLTLGCVAEAENGYYFLSGTVKSYLYFYDKAEKKAVPVCHKPDCLHVDEPDGYKINYCNAYLGMNVRFLNYYNGEIYYVAIVYAQNGNYDSLFKSNADGTSRKRVLDFTEQVTDMQIHRGYVYYSTINTSEKPGDKPVVISKYKMYRYPLNASDSVKPELINSGEQIYGQIAGLLCYRDSVYFSIHYFDDSSMEKSTNYIMEYNTLNKRTKRVLNGGSQIFTVFNDQIVYMLSQQGTFTCDLEGNNIKKVSNAYGYYCSNDEYLFIDNFSDAFFNKKNRFLTILDKSWQQIKAVPLTEMNGATDVPLGCSNELFFFNKCGESNEYGACEILYIMPISSVSDGMRPGIFFRFAPKVQDPGVITKGDSN